MTAPVTTRSLRPVLGGQQLPTRRRRAYRGADAGLIAVGEESLDAFTGRASVATAKLLGQQPTVSPSHHGGFVGGEFGYAGRPEVFARKLREALADAN
jgi:hypothetical protein